MAELTVKYIEAVQRRVRAGERVKEYHPEPSGLALRVRSNGRMSYVVRKGRRPPVTLGPIEIGLSNAREMAAEVIYKLAKGIDPTEEKKAARAARVAEAAAPATTFAEITEQFIERYCKPKLRTWQDVHRALYRDAVPRWGKLPIRDITRPMVAELIDSIVDRGSPRQADIVRSYLHKLFKWSIGRGYVDNNPVSDMERPHTNGARERSLADEELRLIWLAADQAGWPFGPIVQLLALTGQRRSEIAEGRWSEIALDAGVWDLPAVRVKNKSRHEFPLAPKAVDVLRKLPRIDRSDLIFTTTGETAVSGFSKAMRNLNRDIAEMNGGTPIEHWTIHDLRRTVATGMGDLGVPPHVIEAILNHKSGAKAGVAGVYNRSRYWPQMVEAANTWARKVEKITAGGGRH